MKGQHRPVVFNGSSHHPEAVSDELELAVLPSAVSLTRRFIEAHLRKWHLEEMTDTAALVASELVTNAIKATGITEGPADYARLHDVKLARVITRLRLSAPSLFIETWDGGPHPPVPACPGDLDEGGRGLMLVTALTTAWGHYPSASGKVVWAEITIPRRLMADTGTFAPGGSWTSRIPRPISAHPGHGHAT